MGAFNACTSYSDSLGSLRSDINVSKAARSNGGWCLGVRQLIVEFLIELAKPLSQSLWAVGGSTGGTFEVVREGERGPRIKPRD